MKLTVHTIDSAPEGAKTSLEKSKEAYGIVPNLHAVLAESPQALAAYKELGALFQATSFDKEELTVIWQSINVEHACHYCVPAHTAVAKSMKVDAAVVEALRDESRLASAKLEALRDTALAVVRQRGRLSPSQLQDFADAGYTERHLLELIVGVAHKTISNYVNAIAETPIDERFRPFAWTKAASVAPTREDKA